MLNRFVLPALAATFVVGSAVFTVSVRADDAPVTLKYVNKVGDSLRQKVVIKASVQGIDAVMTNTQKRVTKEVKDSGEVTYLVSDEGGTLLLMGNEQHQDPQPDITIKHDKLGKVIDWKPAQDINGALSPELLKTLSQIYSPVLPADAVKPKDVWKVELDNPIYKDKKVKIESTFLGIEKVDTVDLWKVKISAVIPTDGENGVATYEGTFWLIPATGQVAKAEGAAKDIPSQFGKLAFTVAITPAKDEKPAAAADQKAPK